MPINSDCVVIGAGASGLMCSGRIAELFPKKKIILVEKNKNIGKKLLITGKGRCNVTNNCDKDTFFSNVITNSKFLFSAYSTFSSDDTMSFFESLGVSLKTERGNRVFPVSDKSSDIVNALRKYIDKSNIRLINGTLTDLVQCGGYFKCILSDGTEICSESVVLATGGASYPQTGSDGKVFPIVEKLGHTVVELKPSLVPLVVKEKSICERLQGLSLKNTNVSVIRNGKTVFDDFGELVFTDDGLSGPIILSASAHCKIGDVLSLDIKPALDEKTLDNRIVSDFTKYNNKNFSNSLDDLLPKKLIPVFVELSGINPEMKVNSINKNDRKNLVSLFKKFSFTVDGFGPLSEAIVTSGGISVKEIDPKTMQSKIINGLFFCGEMIDIDAYTGGFNLQIAFSTARLAAEHIFD